MNVKHGRLFGLTIFLLGFLLTACSGDRGVSFIPMAEIPGGTFLMAGRVSTTVSGFKLAITELTQAQWSRVMPGNPSRFQGVDLPVEQVSWLEAIEFCNKLSRMAGLQPAYTVSGNEVTWDRTATGYRLPTEAEFEFAARGGTKSQGYRYAGGNNIGRVAWYAGNSGKTTHPSGSKSPNELGLFDLSGNVLEWCWDWYQDELSGGTDPPGPPVGRYFRVIRGGSWESADNRATVAFRYTFYPDSLITGIGFRVARN